MPPPQPLTKSSLPARPNQDRSGAGGKKVGDDGGGDDDAPKIRRGGRKSSPPSPSFFFLTSFRNGKTIRCTSPWAARKRGIPSSDGDARGIRSGAPQRKSGNRGATEAFFLLFRERTVAQPPSKGVESGGAVATHVDPLCMRGTNGGLTAEKSLCFLDGNSGPRETKRRKGPVTKPKVQKGKWLTECPLPRQSKHYTHTRSISQWKSAKQEK